MSELAQIAVILNASAGSGCTADFANSVTDKFREQGLFVSVTLAASGGEVVAASKRAATGRVRIVVAGGGDGTLSAVASTLIRTDIALGVLPLGTLNHFAKDLHIPMGLDDAIRTIAEGHSIQIDAGEVNGRTFINNSSLGLYADTVRHREQQQHRLGRSKWLAFFWAAVTAFRRYPFLTVTLSLDNEEYRRRTPFIFIGNNEYLMEGFNIGARARIDGAKLSLYMTQHTGRLGSLWLAARAVFGRLRQAKDFDALSAKKILIETRHKLIRVATDGEVTVMSTPLHYRTRPAALKVIVPRDADMEE